MSKIALEGNASGTGTFTIAGPNTNTNYTITLPQETGTLVTTGVTTGLNASALSTGTVATARLASGTANSTTFLRGDQTWASADGKVLQVVQSTNSTQVTTTSTSYQSSGLTASITPASASNKILIWARTVARHDNNLVIVTIFRGTTSGTNLGNGNAGMSTAFGNGGTIYVDCSNVYLDSPNTTSSQTYTLAYRSNNGGTAYAQEGNSMAVMVLMEIAA